MLTSLSGRNLSPPSPYSNQRSTRALPTAGLFGVSDSFGGPPRRRRFETLGHESRWVSGKREAFPVHSSAGASGSSTGTSWGAVANYSIQPSRLSPFQPHEEAWQPDFV